MLVPGVSGGSMAMILGIYQKLISAISSFWENKKKNLIFGAPSVRKVPQGGSCISINFVSLKRCNPCGYAAFSLLRSVRWCWKASSISSGVSSWRMPTPL